MAIKTIAKLILSLMIILVITYIILLLILKSFNTTFTQLWNTISESQATLLAAVLTAFIAIFVPIVNISVSHIWDKLEYSWISSTYRTPCKILLVGMARTGKTTLIKQLDFQIVTPNQGQTKYWRIHEHFRKVQSLNKGIKIQIGDYRGQNPGQLFENFDSFAGKAENRTINCILFVVDLFPEQPDLKKSIKPRVNENIAFLNLFALSSIFHLSYSKKYLKCVALLINKIDLLKHTKIKAEEMALKEYESFVKLLNKFCEFNGIPLMVKVGSALEGTYIHQLYSEIINHFVKS